MDSAGGCPVVRPELEALPERLKRLRVDARGYPVPWFVAWVDGQPEFRAASAEKLVRAIREGLCWVCGGQLGKYRAFVIGPMCGVNRTTAEPPCHRACAEWSARNCPFLARPHMERRENDLPEEVGDPAGVMLRRNPGVMLVWVTKTFLPFSVDNGWLLKIGDAESITVWKEGRLATRAELDAALASGLPALAEMAAKEGKEAQMALAEQVGAFCRLVDRVVEFPAGETPLPATGGSDGEC